MFFVVKFTLWIFHMFLLFMSIFPTIFSSGHNLNKALPSHFVDNLSDQGSSYLNLFDLTLSSVLIELLIYVKCYLWGIILCDGGRYLISYLFSLCFGFTVVFLWTLTISINPSSQASCSNDQSTLIITVTSYQINLQSDWLRIMQQWLYYTLELNIALCDKKENRNIIFPRRNRTLFKSILKISHSNYL